MKIEIESTCFPECEKTFCSACGSMTAARHLCSPSGAYTGFTSQRPHRCVDEPKPEKKPSERVQELFRTAPIANIAFNPQRYLDAVCAYLDELHAAGKLK